MRQDDFNIDELQIEAAPPGADRLASKRRPRRQDQFVMVPLEWMHRLCGARYTATWTLALHLLFRAFKERHQTIKLANSLLAAKGVTRRQKWRALGELEAMGLIEVEHRQRKSPNIALLYPAEEV
jgi:hypothetical protein